MKKLIDRVITGLITLSLLASLACHANTTQEVTSFSDVPPAYWGYETIMDMTEYGIFKGTTTPVNGVGTFSPEKTMTRAEFITAALRAVYPIEANAIQLDRNQWWRGYYVLALDKKLIKVFELDDGDLSKPMGREEMAMVMVRCVENMGEELEQRVAVSQIADYYKVAEYYKDYVRDCFSYGLLCGVDSKGTFMPDRTLTRAEAATVLCRLIDEDMRVEVEFVKESVETDDNRWDSYEDETDDRSDKDNNRKPDKNDKEEADKTDDKKPSETDKPEENKPDLMPWEDGGKKPEKYTWDEYTKLTQAEKDAFKEWFNNTDSFNDWMVHAKGENLPWEEGGKSPEQYTWEEYQKLNDFQKEKFYDSFGDNDDFMAWKDRVQDGSNTESDSQPKPEIPWENGGKRPADYTWEEFEALTDALKEAFYESFATDDAFAEWMNNAQGTVPEREIPWENGGKQPSDYTWSEFEALPDELKEAFYESFAADNEFTEWMNNAQGNNNTGAVPEREIPWENGGKQPSDYTWSEFETLPDELKEAFYESFATDDEFTEWMNANKD